MYIYNLAGENLELARAELEGFLESQDITENPVYDGSFALTESEPSMLRRLGLVHDVARVLHRGEKLDSNYSPEGSFAVRSVNVDREYEERLGEILSDDGNSVDLENPDEIINIYSFEGMYIFGRVVEDIDRGLFRQRENKKRPFSSPVSLDPVLARVLVNLSEVPTGGTLFDPFCGTGGILIEAGLCGIAPYGLDFQMDMVEGARENLEEYGIRHHDIREGKISDASRIFEKDFDAVVTDLPYGHASKKKGDPVEEFLDIEGELTNGRTVFMSDQPEISDLSPDYEVYVHKNLTRYIYIMD